MNEHSSSSTLPDERNYGGAQADYQLRAWFYDSGAGSASPYISPDLAGACAVDTAGKRSLGDGGPVGAESSAVGTFTLASPHKYCVASPWESVGTGRSAGWHQFVVKAAAGAVTVEVDGVTVKSTPASATGTPSIDQVTRTPCVIAWDGPCWNTRGTVRVREREVEKSTTVPSPS